MVRRNDTYSIVEFRRRNDCLYRQLELHEKWVSARRCVLLTGNVLAVIYGLAILTTTLWLKIEASKLELVSNNIPLYETLTSCFLASMQITCNGIIGFVAPFINTQW